MIPVWEEVQSEDVVVLKDVMTTRKTANRVQLHYNRIPITAERPPDFADLNELIDVALRSSAETPIVVNCQLGRGRSTLTSVSLLGSWLMTYLSDNAQIILLLIRGWLELHRQSTSSATPRNIKRSMSTVSVPPMDSSSKSNDRHSYQIINSE